MYERTCRNKKHPEWATLVQPVRIIKVHPDKIASRVMTLKWKNVQLVPNGVASKAKKDRQILRGADQGLLLHVPGSEASINHCGVGVVVSPNPHAGHYSADPLQHGQTN